MLKYAVKLLIMAVANAAAIFIMNLNFNTSHVKVYLPGDTVDLPDQ